LLEIKAQLETKLQMHFNGVLANYYRNGKDSMGWHSDAERGLSPTIASISLGQTRRFLFKHRQSKCLQEVKLESGSLLLMQDELQKHWLHCLPKQTKATQARVNLTFRQLELS